MEIEKLKDMLRNAAGGPVGIQMCQEAADALEQLQAENDRLKRERDDAVEKGRILPEKCCCIPTCGGKKVTIVLDVESVKEASHD